METILKQLWMTSKPIERLNLFQKEFGVWTQSAKVIAIMNKFNDKGALCHRLGL
jgi:hypothetical protein